jgi:hypothetical protein
MPTNEKTQQKVFEHLKTKAEQGIKNGYTETNVIANELGLSKEDAEHTVEILESKGLVGSDLRKTVAFLKPQGFKQESISISADQNIIQKQYNVNVNEPSGNTNIAVDHSNINITVNRFFDTLCEEIENNPDVPEEEKKNLIAKVKSIAQHPVVSGLATNLLTTLATKGIS